MNQQVNSNNRPVLPRRSRRLATIIPASHWVSMGYTEEDARLMENLQNDMRKYCDRVDEATIELNGRDEGSALRHHDLMFPHWKKLFKALKGRTNVAFGLVGISMPVYLLGIVFPALQSLNIVDLSLFGIDLGSEGYMMLSSFIKNNSSLTTFGIGADQLDDLSVATALSDAFNDHPTLEDVFIAECMGHNASILEKILKGCKGINTVRICSEEFGSDSIDVLAEFISCNHPTEYINFGHNNISNRDTIVLASALKKNTNLHWLELCENDDITEEGEKALLNVLYDPTSIDSIVQSNHKCRVYTYNFDARDNSIIAHRPPLEKEVLRINKEGYTIGQKIRKKVVLALCGPNRELFDLAFLNDIPLELMPRMLELIQEYGRTRTEAFRFMMPDGREDDILEAIDRYIGPWPSSKQLEKEALSRLFHTLRGWELPSLFVNLNNPPANAATGKRKRRKTCRH